MRGWARRGQALDTQTQSASPLAALSTRVSRKTYRQVKNIRCQESTKQCSTKALELYPRMIHTHPPIRQTTKHDKKKALYAAELQVTQSPGSMIAPFGRVTPRVERRWVMFGISTGMRALKCVGGESKWMGTAPFARRVWTSWRDTRAGRCHPGW